MRRVVPALAAATGEAVAQPITLAAAAEIAGPKPASNDLRPQVPPVDAVAQLAERVAGR